MRKLGLEISFMLLAKQRESGLNIWMTNARNIDLYVGKKRLANFNPEYVSVESLRTAADGYDLSLIKEDADAKRDN